MNHLMYELAQQQIDERTHERHLPPKRPAEHRLRRRTASTLRRMADGLDAHAVH